MASQTKSFNHKVNNAGSATKSNYDSSYNINNNNYHINNSKISNLNIYTSHPEKDKHGGM